MSPMGKVLFHQMLATLRTAASPGSIRGNVWFDFADSLHNTQPGKVSNATSPGFVIKASAGADINPPF